MSNLIERLTRLADNKHVVTFEEAQAVIREAATRVAALVEELAAVHEQYAMAVHEAGVTLVRAEQAEAALTEMSRQSFAIHGQRLCEAAEAHRDALAKALRGLLELVEANDLLGGREHLYDEISTALAALDAVKESA